MITVVTVWQVVYLIHVFPFEEKEANISETLNEIAILFVCYHAITLVHVKDPFTLATIGKSLTVFVFATIICNGLNIIRSNALTIKVQLKRALFRWKHRKCFAKHRQMHRDKLQKKKKLLMRRASNELML